MSISKSKSRTVKIAEIATVEIVKAKPKAKIKTISKIKLSKEEQSKQMTSINNIITKVKSNNDNVTIKRINALIKKIQDKIKVIESKYELKSKEVNDMIEDKSLSYISIKTNRNLLTSLPEKEQKQIANAVKPLFQIFAEAKVLEQRRQNNMVIWTDFKCQEATNARAEQYNYISQAPVSDMILLETI